MTLSTHTTARRERDTSKFCQGEEACVGVRKMVVPLPSVLVAYMTIHEQFRYPRILRVHSDTKALQAKLDRLMASPERAAALEADPAAAEERAATEARTALDHLKLAACLYAPFSDFYASAFGHHRRADRGSRATAMESRKSSEPAWAGERRRRA